MKGVSVIICCYNSASRIEPTLVHLKNQVINHGLNWEIILVNNNSTDNTVSIASRSWQNAKIPLHILDEPEPGQSYARLAGVHSAAYKYIIFCDDDNWLCPTYIQIVFDLLENNSQVGAVGGQSMAAFAQGEPVPEWFALKHLSYATGKQAKRTGDVTERLLLWGAGMGTRKEAYLKAFDPKWPGLLVGRTGKELSSGDDSEYCMRLVLMGYKLYYDERLFYHHFISSNRLTESYIQNLEQSFKNSYGTQVLYSELIQYFIFKKGLSLNDILKSLLEEFFQKKFHFNKTRRLMFWKWGYPSLNDKAMHILRSFYFTNAYSKGKIQ